ncbi:MAG: class I SAM-dependent methyltransferase [Haloplanus sp.]
MERKNARDDERQYSRRCEILSDVVDASSEQLRAYENEIESDSEFLDEFQRRRDEIQDAAESAGGDSNVEDAITLYVLVRATEPDAVLQTGVLYGVFDAYVCRALDRNGHGTLHSIDLPNDEYENGYYVPEWLRGDWNLHLGDVDELLPALLDEIGSIDLFIHDSHHTPNHMTWEYETAFPSLSSTGYLATHDVDFTNSFDDFTTERSLSNAKIASIGVARK